MNLEKNVGFKDREYFGGREKTQKIRQGFLDMGLNYDAAQNEDENLSRLQTLKFLGKQDAINISAGKFFVDPDKFKHLSFSASFRTHEGQDSLKIAQALKGLKAIDKTEALSPDNQAPVERPVVEFPESVADLTSFEKQGYGARAGQAIVQPWEISAQVKHWTTEIQLPSGETTNLSEMLVAWVLNECQARREENGRLTVINPQTKQRVKFSPSFIREWFHIQPIVTTKTESGGKKSSKLEGNPYAYAQKYLPNLLREGILRKEDFRIMGGRATAEVYNVHERKLNPNAPYVTFANPDAQTAKYYVGRGKLIGTDIKINPDTMKAVQLDTNTIAIVEENNGKKEIVLTFSLLPKEQMDVLQVSVKERLARDGLPATGKNIAGNTVVGEKIMRQLIRSYSVADFLPARPGEPPGDYYKRLRPLDDVSFVTEKVHGFFSRAGIGVHNLPWAEQLVLSRAFLEGIDEKRLLEFSKQYGLSGVRTFLSLDYDRKLGNEILSLGEKLEPSLAKEVFTKYGEIVDAARQAEGYVASHLKDDTKGLQQSGAKVREQLLRKAKDLLAGLAQAVSAAKGQLEAVSVLEQMKVVKSDVMLFAATCKNLPPEAKLDFQDMAGVTIEEKDSKNLPPGDKAEMIEIFQANRLTNYPEALRTKTSADFKKTLDEPGHTFRLLKHEGKIVAFFHYDQLAKDRLYVGSLNLHPSAKDSPIAVAFVKSAMAEHPDKKIEAVVWDTNLAKLFYKRGLGFREVGEDNNYHGTGERYLKLERPKQQSATELPEPT